MAIDCFNKVVSTASYSLMSAIHKSVSLKHSDRIPEARESLINLISNKSIPSEIIAKGLIQIGLLEAENNNFKLSRKYLFKALRMKSSNPNDLSKLRNNIAISYLIESEVLKKTNEPNHKVIYRLLKALDNFKESIRLARKFSEPYHLANLEDNIALTYVQLKKYKLAKRKHFKALNIYKSLYQYREEASCLDNIGVFYKESGDYLNAIKYFRNALNLKLKYSTKRRIALTKHNIAEVFFIAGKYKFALKWAQEAENIFRAERLQDYQTATKELINQIENCLHITAPTKNWRFSG